MRKILQNRNKGLPLQPQIGDMVSYLRGDRFFEIFLKKVSKIFGRFKNMNYLCTAFPL